jgi:hypothetical protein
VGDGQVFRVDIDQVEIPGVTRQDHVRDKPLGKGSTPRADQDDFACSHGLVP